MRTILRNLYEAETEMDRQNYGLARQLVAAALDKLQDGPWIYLEYDKDAWARTLADVKRRAEAAAQEAARKDFAQMAQPCHGGACSCSSGASGE